MAASMIFRADFFDSPRGEAGQFRELRDAFPLPALGNIYTSNLNSEYVNTCSYVKNCYLCFNSDFDEDCAYSDYLEKSRRCFDLDYGLQNELCYDSTNLFKCYRVQYSANVDESIDVLFSRDLKNCSNCLGCINLRNKQYCIFNEQKTKEEYFEELKKYDLKSRDVIENLKKKTQEFFLKYPRKHMTGKGSTNITGEYIYWSKNVRQSYELLGVEDSKYCQFFNIEGSKNCMDVTMWGSNLMQAYECLAVGNNQNNIKFCSESWHEASNLTYCSRILAPNSDLFGCIGLRNQQYCILNTKFEKSAYAQITNSIIEDMRKRGEYGEFFPASMSLIGYNESFANKYLPLSKEEALAKGFRWSEPEERNYEIGGDVIACEHKVRRGGCNQQCTTAFRLTTAEKDFYQQFGIATPRLCPNCRHYERLQLRNPIALYSRQCAKCSNDIETSYSPDRKELVYCEACYQAEVV